MGYYQVILEDSLLVLEKLPVVIPDKGNIAGFTVVPYPGNGPMRSADNVHYPMGTSFLQYGVNGVADIAAEKSATATDEHGREFMDCVAQVYRAVAKYFSGYVTELTAMIEAADAEAEKERLTNMRNNMQVLAAGKPQTFVQALQLEYLMWRLRCITGTACVGRLDVHLREFYEKDIAEGRIDKEAAINLLCQVWEMMNQCGSGDTLLNVMVGGKRRDGSDAGGELSICMLEASIRTQKSEPHLNVRVYKGMPEALLEATYRLQMLGHGQATLYNDDVVIPALIKAGIPEKYAYRYANDGCTEIVIDGGSDIEFRHIDAVATVELAMNNGQFMPKWEEPVRYWHRCQTPGNYVPDVVCGYDSGDISDMKTFEDFYRAYLRQYHYQVSKRLEELHWVDNEVKNNVYRSLLVNGSFETVLESGKDMCRGGLPTTDLMLFGGSLSTVADCLCAVKTVVYDKKLYTLEQVKEAMIANYEGYEEMRKELHNAPKFGNDLDEVDLIAADLVKHFCDWIEEEKEKTGLLVWPALVGWKFVEEAYGTVATPDGRKRKDPIAEHFCATPGKAVKGPTAILNSICKAPIHRAFGVAAAHVTLPKNIVSDEASAKAFLDIFCKAAMEKGIVMLNIAFYDVDLLRAAQKDPEHHEDVIVRVWGYSARFVDLGEEMQEHVISRILQ